MTEVLSKVPTWVNQNKLREFCAANIKNFKELLNFDITSTQKDGENYMTLILRLKMKVKKEDDTTKKLEFILKVPYLEDEAACNEYHNLFVVETDMYAKKISELENICQKAFGGMKVQFAPKYYKFPTPPEMDHILMQDLVASHYYTVDRRQGLDEFQTKSALDKLALFHAASAKRVELKGNYEESYIRSFYTQENYKMFQTINEHFSKPFAKCLEDYKLLAAHKRYFSAYLDKLTELQYRAAEVNDGSFNVLNHGDFWISNLLFKPNTERFVKMYDVNFVDFQFSKYGSPALDLLTFLMTSPNIGIRLAKFDQFISFYHLKLGDYARKVRLRKPMPTIYEFRSELRESGVWAFLAVQRLLAVGLLDPYENTNIETFLSNNIEGFSFKCRMYSHDRYRLQVEEILPWLIRQKYVNPHVNWKNGTKSLDFF